MRPSPKGITENIIAWAILAVGAWMIHHFHFLSRGWNDLLIVALAALAIGIGLRFRITRSLRRSPPSAPAGGSATALGARPTFSCDFITKGDHFWLVIPNHGPVDVPDPPLPQSDTKGGGMAAASNTLDCIRELSGRTIIGTIVQGGEYGPNHILVLDDGTGFAFNTIGSYWRVSKREIETEVRKLRRDYEHNAALLADVLAAAGESV